MRYLLDTNHVSFIERRHPVVTERVGAAPASTRFVISVITQAELLGGIELATSGKRRDELRRFYEQTMASLADVMDVTSATARVFAGIWGQLRRKGRPIETNDMWIAATAIEHNLTLLSNDAHFGWIEGLLLDDWSRARPFA